MAGTSTNQWLSPTPWSLVAGAPFTRRSWHELLYALVAFPLGVFGFAFVVASLFVGVFLSVILIGLVVFVWSTSGVRQLGAFNRSLVRRLLDGDVPPPAPFQPGLGVVGWARRCSSTGAGWRARAYLGLLKFPLALASFIAVIMLRRAVCGSFWPRRSGPPTSARRTPEMMGARHYVINFGSFHFDTWQRTLLLTTIGLAGWWLSPWVFGGRSCTSTDSCSPTCWAQPRAGPGPPARAGTCGRGRRRSGAPTPPRTGPPLWRPSRTGGAVHEAGAGRREVGTR